MLASLALTGQEATSFDVSVLQVPRFLNALGTLDTGKRIGLDGKFVTSFCSPAVVSRQLFAAFSEL